MTRVLVVHHDIDMADAEVDVLRKAGYEVDQCVGPTGGSPCPVMNGETCWQVDKADVLLYDMWATGEGHRELIDDLRDLHPDKPVVLTSPGLILDWVESEGATPVVGAPTQANLVMAVESAVQAAQTVGTVGTVGPAAATTHKPRAHVPSW